MINNSEYYYLIMSQQDVFENEILEEILRERTNSYLSQNKNLDFWLLINPSFIDNEEIFNKLKLTNFYKQKNNCLFSSARKSPFYAIILSSNETFITWLGLRLGYFENLDTFKSSNKNYLSNGVSGKIILKNKEESKDFIFSNKFVHPYFLEKKYNKLLYSFHNESNKI